MDRATRDTYRKVLERISKGSSSTEIQVAQKVVESAHQVKAQDAKNLRMKHVGYFLLDDGVFQIESSLNYRSPIKERIIRFIDEDPTFIYFGSLVLLMVFFISMMMSWKGPDILIFEIK
jgi:cyclic beta-1,2-glucan synthetase